MSSTTTSVAAVTGAAPAGATAARRGAVDLVDPGSLQDIVSIQCYGRSGSIFLASLLDSHPQVLMLPGVQLSAFYKFWRTHGELPAIQALGTFLATFRAIYQVHQPNNVPIFGEKPFGDRPSPVDAQIFTDTMLRLIVREVDDVQTMPVSRKYFFQALHAAYAIALGREVRWDKAVIVYSLHEPLAEHATPFANDFPNARYLHAVREPVRGSVVRVVVVAIFMRKGRVITVIACRARRCSWRCCQSCH